MVDDDADAAAAPTAAAPAAPHLAAGKEALAAQDFGKASACAAAALEAGGSDYEARVCVFCFVLIPSLSSLVDGALS